MAITRRRWVGGNWKCNGSLSLVKTLAEALNPVEFDAVKLGTCLFTHINHMNRRRSFPPALFVPQSLEAFNLKRFKIGVQNFSQVKCGAFTGEFAIPMLNDLGLEWSLIGHSERRALFGETDEIVAAKVALAQQAKLHTAVCIGENLAEREEGRVSEVVTRQINAFVGAVTDWDLVVVAYEPVWAIGTGKVATCEEVKEVHQLVRDLLTEKIGAVAESVRIVYGGSVNEANCHELLGVPNMDGFLVGGKSITPGFGEIIVAAHNEK